MNPIFISYRRDDGIDTAQLLQRDLQNMFGDDAVFLDTRTMKAGDKFPSELENAVKNARIVIAMIGKYWKGSDPQIKRLMQEDDWVRKELEMALGDGNKKIFPVFVKGTKSSDSFKDLPSSLKKLTKFNGVELREKEFKHDLLQLLPVIEPFVPLNDPLKDLPIDENKYRYPQGSPFKGLDYFTENDAKIFFGRGYEIRKLYNKIRNNNLVMLFGQSGSGKSSLLFAGLKPRLDKKGYTIPPIIRREAGVNLAEKLDEYLLSSTAAANQLVILDQVEEILTNPNKRISSDAELQQLLSSVKKGIDKKIHILLSFRKEYLAEIEKLFADIKFEKTYLEPLQTRGVLDAIRGITLSDEAQDNYELKFADAEVPMAIAQAVLADEESHVAPLLQVILRKMWDKADESKPRIFSKELLEEVKSKNLVTFLNDQITAMKEKFPTEVDSGLVLDVLYFFTTPRGTSAARTPDELVAQYDHKDIRKIVTEIKNKYLLSEPKTEAINITRLAHDALAPLIRELYSQSTLPGQRASRLLESKKHDIEAGAGVEFSKSDIAIIDSGKMGMRRITEAESQVIEHSRVRILKYELDLEEKIEQRNKALEEAQKQALQARAKTLAASAMLMKQTDITMALRLAEAACKTTPEPTKEAKSAFVDIAKSGVAFYKYLWFSSSEINAVTFSPDGKYILTGSKDKTARLWSLDGSLKQTFEGHQDGVTSVVFSPDGNYILTGSLDKTARLWSLDGTLNQTFEGHQRHVKSVAFSTDGKYLLTGSMDESARLWSLDGKLKQSFEGHQHFVNSVAFSPDGKKILTGNDDGIARLWSLDGTLKQTFKGHTYYVSSVAFSHDGKYILTGSGDSTARLWSLEGTLMQTFKGHQHEVTSVAFSPDGKYILTGSMDKTARLWSLDGILKQSFEGHQHVVNSVALSPDGKYIITGSNDKTARLWLLDRILNPTFLGHKSYVNSVAFSPVRKYILTGSADGTARLWSLDGTQKQSFEGHQHVVTSVAFSPDGEYVLTGSMDKTARLWSLDGTLKQTFEGHQATVSSVAFSPDGKYILSGSLDKTAHLWSRYGILKQSFEGHQDEVTSVAFSPYGNRILTGSFDNTARLWSLDGSLIQTFEGHQYWVISVLFSPDGKYIITGSFDKTARLWCLDGTLRHIFEGQAELVTSVVFSPDSNYILICSSDKTARLWSLDGTLKQVFEGHENAVGSVAFSPDGKYILTGSSRESEPRLWRPFWEMINPENTYVPTPEQMQEYDISEDMEWGKVW